MEKLLKDYLFKKNKATCLYASSISFSIFPFWNTIFNSIFFYILRKVILTNGEFFLEYNYGRH